MSDSNNTNICCDGVTKSAVVNAINESEDLVTALESVAAMYGIPSTHIIEDDSIKSIKVIRDNIFVPATTNSVPRENAKSIVQAIGTVLDYISQRVDDKLNNFQNNNIKKGIITHHISVDANPSKGKVIARYEDSNGDEILVYDTGLLDMGNTKEAHNKVDELKALGKIPEFKHEPESHKKYTYFTDEDDISNGIDMSSSSSSGGGDFGGASNASSDASSDTSFTDAGTNSGNDSSSFGNAVNASSESMTTDVSSTIKESYITLDTISKYNNTRHLGYEILQEQGFDFIKPVNVIQEATVQTKDIEYMKFDNTNLLKAIEYLNKARVEQADSKTGKLDLKKLIDSDNYQKAIDALNKQFNARIQIRFFKGEKNEYNTAFTQVFNDIKTHLTISKSKGFQLGGLPISIFVSGHMLEEDAPDDISLFGQHTCALFCHEIFHNIMSVLRTERAGFDASLTTTLVLASDMPNAKDRRKIVTNFVDSIDEMDGKKLNKVSRLMLVKQLTYIASIKHDEKALADLRNVITTKGKTTSIDQEIARYTKAAKKLDRRRYLKGGLIATGILTTASICLSIAFPALIPVWAPIFIGNGLGVIFSGVALGNENTAINNYRNGKNKNYEEYWCDMFAAMYNLPVTFFMIGSPRQGAANDLDTNKLKKLNDLEREISSYTRSTYPTVTERNYAAVKVAKQTLEKAGDDLDPSIKKYLEWIVKNYSSTLDMDIDLIYNKTTFDPDTAEDLDKHIQDIIDKGNVALTEYDLSWLFSDEDDVEFYY